MVPGPFSGSIPGRKICLQYQPSRQTRATHTMIDSTFSRRLPCPNYLTVPYSEFPTGLGRTYGPLREYIGRPENPSTTSSLFAFVVSFPLFNAKSSRTSGLKCRARTDGRTGPKCGRCPSSRIIFSQNVRVLACSHVVQRRHPPQNRRPLFHEQHESRVQGVLQTRRPTEQPEWVSYR